MAGIPTKTSGLRKQWQIFAGPCLHCRSRGVCLAEDGCPESQVELAKQLLEERSVEDDDQEESDRLGVYWLVKASEQGHVEATNMLQTCLESGRGINDFNIVDVKACLDMPQAEKVSRQAARKLFANLSQGEDFITGDQLLEEIKRTQSSPKKEIRKSIEDTTQPVQRHRNWTSRVCVYPSKLTEDMLMAAASHHSRGELPIVGSVVMLNNHLSQETFLQASLFSPFLTIKSSYECLIGSIGKQPMRSFLPLNAACAQTLVILAVYTFLGLEGIIEAIPSFLFYAALAVMFITTCQILTKKWDFNELKRWSNLLVAWGGPDVNAEQAQWAHCSNNIYPCFVFLFSFIASILLTPFVSPYNMPYSELTVVSVIASLVVLYNFAWYKGRLDYLSLFSFGVGMLARYPYETDDVVSTSWRFMDVRVPTFASYVVGNGIEFCFNFKVIFFLMMPGLLVKMGSRERWKGLYTSLVPHLISLSWWQMAVLASNGATRFGLIRSCLAVLVVIVFVPLAGLTVVVLPIVALLKFFLATENFLPVSMTLAFSCLGLVVLLYLGTRPTRTGRVIGWIQVLLGVFAAGLLVWPHVETLSYDWYTESVPFTWKQYNNFCSPRETVSARSHEKCSTLAGLFVHGEGLVESTAVIAIHNPLANVVSKLPVKMQNVISCIYGEKYESSQTEDSPHPDSSSKRLERCHLANWNRYEYAIGIKMVDDAWIDDGSRVVLRADNVFRNFSTSLVDGDKIWFAGALEINPAHFSSPRVHLHQVGCLACFRSPQPPLTVHSLATATVMAEVWAASRHLLNVLFNPAIVFK